MFNSILVVCTGNICRSPIAERILRNLLPEKKIDSAGTGALVDHPADSSAIEVSFKHGLSVDNHKGKKVSSRLAQQYDLILVMEKLHMEKICEISPESRGKIMLLGHWDNQREIPDPYRKSQEAFESVYKLIENACLSWAKKLN